MGQETKHTVGPWILDDEYPTDVITPDKKVMIAHVTWIDPDADGHFAGHVTEANARLIAAAPELLAALKALLGPKKYRQMWLSEELEAIKMAEAVIAKAEGKA